MHWSTRRDHEIDLRPYRHKPNTWEADITMLVRFPGHEVRRRWKSPMPSRAASERWAREKALGFLADEAGPKQEEKPNGPEEKRSRPSLSQALDGAARRRQPPAGLDGRHLPAGLDAHLVPLLGDLRLDRIDAEAVQRFKAARADRNMASTVNKALGRLKTILRSAIEWKVIRC